MNTAKHTTPAPQNDAEKFLLAFFGNDWPRAWSTGFTESPFAPSLIADKTKASALSARMWAGGYYRKMKRLMTDDANQYVAISLFKPAPWMKNGVQQLSAKRRKSHFERGVAVMVDDIGEGQKVHPSRLKLPCTALIETSPGNCQGWYKLDPLDEDTHDPDLIALLLERMVAAGLTNDLTDPGMKGVTRYGRLPGGVNNKPGRDVWQVKLRSLNPKRVYTVSEIADAYGLDLTAPVVERREPGAAADSLVTKLAEEGLQPVDKGDGKWDVQCPWVEGHTQAIDSGTAYFVPSAENGWVGGFRCHHGHCEERHIGDLFRWLDDRQGDAVARLGQALKGMAPAERSAAPERPKKTEPLKPKVLPTVQVTRRDRASFKELMAKVHPPTPWAVENMIAPGVTLLAAPPKAGKSYFVQQMGLCVADGKPFLGRQTRKQKVAYFNLEEWEEMLQPRVRDICAAHGLQDPDIDFIFSMNIPDGETFLDRVQEEVNSGAGLVIIDLFARVRDEMKEDAKKNAYARDYNALKAIADFVVERNPNTCVIIVHHTNKGQHAEWQDKISGSQGLAGATHCNIVLNGLDRRGLDEATRAKVSNYRVLGVTGKQVKAQEMMLRVMDGGGGWEQTDETEEQIKSYGTRAHILQVLREANGAWMTAKDIKELVPGTLDAIKKMLVRLAQAGDIISSGTGGAGYRLKPDA